MNNDQQRDRPILRRILLFVSLLLLTGAGCIRINFRSPIETTVFETLDGGKQWSPVERILTAGDTPQYLRSLSPRFITIDPTDPSTLYLSAEGDGLYVTSNHGQTWRVLDSTARTTVSILGVDPQRTCTLYAGVAQQLWKSTDCGRRWETILQIPKSFSITAMAMHPREPSRLLVGTNSGDLFLSNDYGSTWESPLRIPSAIAMIRGRPDEPQEFYIWGAENEFFRSLNGGSQWDDLSQTFQAASQGTPIRSAQMDVQRAGHIMVATSDRILNSEDRGLTWKPIPLLTSPQTSDIRTFVIDPQDSNALYYATSTTFYRSKDGGKLWQALPLPSPLAAYQLAIDPTVHGHLYLSVAVK